MSKMEVDLLSFLQRSVTPEKQMEDAIVNNDIDQVGELIKKGFSIQAKLHQTGGNTALHLAAKHGYLLLLQKLLAAGADPMAKNDFNFSPINLAARQSHHECLESLIASAGNFPDVETLWLQFGGSMILWRESTDEVIGTLLRATPNLSATRSNVQHNLFFLLQSKQMYCSLKLLMLTGNQIDPQQMQRFQEERDKNFLDWLKTFRHQPQSLQHYCRLVIRRSFFRQYNVFYGTKKLPLPQRMKDYICMKNDSHVLMET